MKIQKKYRIRIILLSLYLSILPIDATLGNIIGSISLINYIAIFYILLRGFSLLSESISVKAIEKSKIPIFYFVFFLASMTWSGRYNLSEWYIFSLMGSFFVFIFAALDKYSLDEYVLLKKAVVISGLIVVLITLINFDFNSGGRFNLNVGRYMDPNYYATGLILINAVLMENILRKKNLKRNIILLALLIIIIIMTGSRGGLLANAMVVITSFVFDRRSQFKKIALIFIMSLFFLLIFYAIQDLIPDWVLNRFTLNEIQIGGGSGRVNIWSYNLSYFANMPIANILFGTGFSTFASVSELSIGVPKVAHSIYIQSLIEGGIIGLMLIMLLLISSIRRSWRNNNYFATAALIGASVGGLVLDIHISRFFWMILLFSIIVPYKNTNRSLS